MKFRRVLLLMFLGLVCVQAHADEPKKGLSLADIPKLNRDITISKEQFENKTTLFEESPLADKFLAYKIRLGKDWVKVNDTHADLKEGLSKQILGDVVLYLGPATLDLRSSFRMRASDLPFDVDAKDWFLNYIFTNGYNLQGMDVPSEKRVQAQYVTFENGVQSVVRASVQISGGRVILAEYTIPVELWPTEKDMAKYSIASFTLTNFDPSSIEDMLNYSFVDIAQFSYPTSWILNAPPISSIERMSASITNLKGGVIDSADYRREAGHDTLLIDGKIDISVVTKGPDTSIDKEVTEIKKQLLSKGLVLGNLIEPIEGWEHNPAITFSKIEAYTINNQSGGLANYEEWVGVFETPGRYYFVRLLTAGRQENFLTWARNVQTFKGVIKTLGPARQ